LEAIKEGSQRSGAETDEELDGTPCDIIEIARSNGVSDPETLKQILLTGVLRSDAP
jgi:hypothetical protein